MAQRLQVSDDMSNTNIEQFSRSIVDFDEPGGAQSLPLPELDVAVVVPPADGEAAVVSPPADEGSPIMPVDPETFLFKI